MCVMKEYILSGSPYLGSCAFQHLNFISAPKTFAEAQSFCREKCVDLVTVHDVAEMEVLLERFQDQYEDALWIGLKKGTSRRWHWSLADEHFYKEGERSYLNWGTTSDNNCGSFRNRLLHMRECLPVKFAVCFDETRSGLEQYTLTSSQMDWLGARDFCRTHHTDLASVRNAAESQMINEVSGDLEVWVGLFRDPWVWSDDDYSSFRHWVTGKEVYTTGDPACVAMLKSQSGRWDERPCGQKLPFICHCFASHQMSFHMTLSAASGLDWTNPVVQQHILQKIREQLDSLNITSVHWRKHSDGSVFKRKHD
uniref:C-type lectin domain-containing protein n=1 Tax=Neogobius melanostomus TaxID=47308 RepID=A0A8C6TMZ5_9GOBI